MQPRYSFWKVDMTPELVLEIQNDPKLPCHNQEVPIPKWSGWQFDSHCEIFSLHDRKKLAKHVGSQKLTHHKVSNKPHPTSRGFLSRVRPTC